MASALPFITIVMAGHVPYRRFPGNIGQRWLAQLFPPTPDPYFALVYNLRNVSVVMGCPRYWGTLWKAW